MSDSNILLANDARIASERRTRSANGKPYVEEFQRLSPCPIGQMPLPLAAYLTATSSVEMAVDGGTPVKFDLAPADGAVYRVDRIVLVASLATAPEFTEFGDIAALANGVTLAVLDTEDVSIFDVLGGQALKSNNDLDAVGKLDVRVGSASFSLRCELALSTPIRLDGAAGEKLRATVSDNLSGLTRLRAFVSGVSEATLT